MTLPRKLKNMTLFNDGQSYLGEVASVTLPTLARSFEEYRGGGMDGPVKIDMGQQAMEMEWKCGGFMRDVCRQFGVTTVNGVMLRFVGAYQNDQTGAVDQVEIVVRGRHEEITPGEAKPGDDTEFGAKTACSYYKLSMNGEVLVEIDILNMVFMSGGVDRLAEIRNALGVGGGSLDSLLSVPRIPGIN